MSAIIIRIIYANLLPFFALLILFFMVSRNYLFDKKQSQLFKLAITINAVLLVAISLDSILSVIPDSQYAWFFRRFTTFLNFAASPLIPLLLLKIHTNRKHKLWVYIPAIANLLLCFFSMFFKLVFEITITNGYGRGIFFFVPFSMSVLYIISLIYEIQRTEKRHGASERIFLWIAILLLSGCMYLEIVEGYRYLSWDCSAILITMYYLLININNSDSDSLTGVYNHAMYMKRLSEIDGSQNCVIAFLDINNFKDINDTWGHAVGDEYLIRFARLLQGKLQSGASVYRIGGDEFAVITKKWDVETLNRNLEAARYEAQSQKYDFAYGISSYQTHRTMEKTLKEADAAMYANKKKCKEKAINE